MADPPFVEPPYSTHLGVIRNKSQLYNVGIYPVKASTTLIKGDVVNFIADTGVEKAPHAAGIVGRIGMIGEGSVNATTSAGGSEVQVWGSGTIGVVKAGGDIDASAGRALTTPTAAGTDAGKGPIGTLVALALTATNSLNHIADYLGHFGEDIEVGKVPTDASLGDEIVVRFR